MRNKLDMPKNSGNFNKKNCFEMSKSSSVQCIPIVQYCKTPENLCLHHTLALSLATLAIACITNISVQLKLFSFG